MEYCIVNKIEFIDGQTVYTPVGYDLGHDDCDLINSTYYKPFEDWINNNIQDLQSGTKTLAEYFSTNPKVYVAHQHSTTLEGMGLNEITFNDL